LAAANHFIYRHDFQQVGNETLLLSYLFNLFVLFSDAFDPLMLEQTANFIQDFNNQLTHTTLKNVELY